MLPVKLSRPETKVYVSDFAVLEEQISAKLPDSFRDFYLASNGGVSNKDWWESEGQYEPFRVKRFKAIAQSGASDAMDTKYIGGCYSTMVGRNVIPQTILPFAIDDGGNFVCLDLKDGCVCFYATDTYDPDLTTAQNHLNSYRWLADSFSDFLSGLKDESEVDV